MLRRSLLARGGGGHGPLFPIKKDGHLAPVHIFARENPKPAPKGYRQEVKYSNEHFTKFTTFQAAVPHKKAVPIPETEKLKASVRSVSDSLSHKKRPLNEIAERNIREKAESEALMKKRDFLAHKVPAPEPVPRTGDVVELNEFFERWVLDHRCILNDNVGGIKPVKMPWVK